MKISIKTVLMGGFGFVIVFLVSLIIFSSYYSTKQAMQVHVKNIMYNMSDFAVDKSKQFMKTARNAAELTQRLESKKVVNSKDSEIMINYFYEQLQINKEFSSIYYANLNGDFIILLRNEDGFLSKSIRTDHIGNRTVNQKTYNKDMSKVLNTMFAYETYDPRTRPWYKKAIAKNCLIWTDPYVFFTSQQPGITTASPIYSDDKISGVVGVDIEIEDLSKFISNLKISKNGKVFMMTKTLDVLAFPNIDTVYYNEEEGKPKLRNINNLGDEVALQSYKILASNTKDISNKKSFLTFTSKNGIEYNALFLPFQVNNIQWIIGMYIPQDDYLGTIKENQKFNIIITIVIALIFMIISYFLSRSIIKPVLQLQEMAHDLKELKLNTPSLDTSYFVEINEAIEAQNTMKDSLKDAYVDTLYRLAIASEYKDTDTAEHIQRIGNICVLIGKKLNLGEEELYILEYASAMHDIGKMAIADEILLKPGRLTPEERKVMEKHAALGAQILNNPTSDIMKEARDISLYHHEKWDGTGYPHQLKGKNIPLNARIVAVADVFDALISKRCYKEAMSADKAIAIILEGSGTHFDPQCVEAFKKTFDELI